MAWCTGYTDHDRPLTMAGQLLRRSPASAPARRATRWAWRSIRVDVEGALSSDGIRDEDIAAGLYDGARVETLLVNWREPADFVLMRTATIGKITRSRPAVRRRA